MLPLHIKSMSLYDTSSCIFKRDVKKVKCHTTKLTIPLWRILSASQKRMWTLLYHFTSYADSELLLILFPGIKTQPASTTSTLFKTNQLGKRLLPAIYCKSLGHMWLLSWCSAHKQSRHIRMLQLRSDQSRQGKARIVYLYWVNQV